jgi:hypothetical protein
MKSPSFPTTNQQAVSAETPAQRARWAAFVKQIGR